MTTEYVYVCDKCTNETKHDVWECKLCDSEDILQINLKNGNVTGEDVDEEGNRVT